MNQGELQRLLAAAVGALEEAGIRYHVTGGLASSFHGEPRLTQDADFVVSLLPNQADRLVAALSQEFLVEPTRVEKSQSTGFFQALHRDLVMKADFHVGESVPGELDRSCEAALFEGLTVRLVSKEDAIISKLLWLQRGSAKSRNDVLGMLLDPAPVDHAFLKEISGVVGCTDLLHELLEEASVGSE